MISGKSYIRSSSSQSGTSAGSRLLPMFVMVLVRFLKWQERRMERKVVSDYVSVSTDRSIDDLATTTEQFSGSRLMRILIVVEKCTEVTALMRKLNLVPAT